MVYLPHWPIPASFGNSQIDYEQVFNRMLRVLEKLNNPHLKLPPVIHVVGTNGKGSCASFLKEILKNSNLKVNLYTSPHIHNCNERIIIENIEISDPYLYKIIEEVRIASEEVKLTFFESFTIAAFLAFSKSNADICIIEAGMGARIDATNIINSKLACIITPISYDHEEYLGDNIAKIAYEKAFVLRKNTNLIIGPQPKQALQIIKLMANDQKANSIIYDENYRIEINEDESFNFYFQNLELLNLPKPSLIGSHQYINASIAIACALSLDKFKIAKIAIEKSLKSTFWRSRLEKINNSFSKKLTTQSSIFIDGAHNLGGAFALKNWIDKQDKIDKEPKKTIVILGFSRNKCTAEFLLQFKENTKKIIAVRVNGEPYPEKPETIYEIAKKSQIKINCQEDLLDAFNYILQKYKNEALRIVICGSLHLARDLKELDKHNFN